MRLKEFLIVLIVFTILYITFFIIYDFLALKKFKAQEKERAFNAINPISFQKFSYFYGISNPIDINIVRQMYLDLQERIEINLAKACEPYGLTSYEYVVAFLYLEYYELIPKKAIAFDNGIILNHRFQDDMYINKYNGYFENRSTFNNIVSVCGPNSANELYHMDRNFLVPGVRILNSTIYYYNGE